MNERERRAVADLVSEWEWNTAGSTSSASTYCECGQDVISVLGISDIYLNESRMFRIIERMGVLDDDGVVDALFDMLEAVGYDSIVDIIDKVGFDGLLTKLENLDK